MPLHISSEPDASPEDVEFIDNAINEYNISTTGQTDYAPIRLFVRDDAGQICGGLIGYVWGKWLKLELLWLSDELRKQGYGSQLLQQAEDEGRAKGAINAFVDTFSFQAPDFYRRYGYEVMAEYVDFPPGHSHFYMRKTL